MALLQLILKLLPEYQIKIKFSFYSLYYAEACDDWRCLLLISPNWRVGKTTPKKRRMSGESFASGDTRNRGQTSSTDNDD